MKIQLEDSIYILGEQIDIFNVDDLKHDLIKYIQSNKTVTLDGSIVEKIDAYGFQMLISAYKMSYLNSKNFSFIGVSNKLRNLLEVTGFLDLIDNE